MNSFDVMLQAKLDTRHAKGNLRVLATYKQEGVYITRNGKRLLSFASNDYLGIAAQLHTQLEMPCGAGASRLVSGNHPLYDKVEAQLAKMKDCKAALLFGSGYLANIGTVPALVGKGDLILMDRLSHACMIDGATLSSARIMRYRHNDMTHLRALLTKHRAHYRHCLIMTETIFSMDGDAALLDIIADIAHGHDAWLLTDDAHGFGVQKIHNPAHIQLGTLSKAAGCYGGYVCGSQQLREMLINYAPSLIFSTALPPTILQSIYDALHIMANQPERQRRVMRLTKQLCDALSIPMSASPIIPIIIGESNTCIDAQQQLMQRGIYLAAIRPPTVPYGTARLRICLSAAHDDAHIEQLIEALSTLE